MSVVDAEKLIQPLSPEAPSGNNLEYDAAFVEMVRTAQGKPEQQMGDTVVAAEEPNWREVKSSALSLLGRTKDLRVATLMARALLHTDGMPGLGDGLAVLHGLLDRHWETVHPQLDPDDNNDPTIRVNTIASICHGDTMLRSVRETPLVFSRAQGRFSLRDVLVATGRLPAPAASATPVPDVATIDAAFRESDLEALQANSDALGRCVQEVGAVEAVLTEKVGAAQAADLSDLSNLLKSAQKVLAEQLGRRGVVVAGAGDAPGVGGAPGVAGMQAMSVAGEIATREDAVRVLEKVCDYFDKHEPSSPVPLLLRRAKRLVRKNFMEIMKDLAPGGITEVERIRGAEEDGK